MNKNKAIKTIKFIKTQMTESYKAGFIFRLVVFVAVFTAYLYDKEALYGLVLYPIKLGITPLHILWLGFMLTMLSHLFPTDKLPMSLRKFMKKSYEPAEGYSEI